MGLTHRLSKAANNFLSSINTKNIYEWIMSDQNTADSNFNPILKMARTDYNLFLAEMSPEEKSQWERCHQKGREMAYQALNDYKNSEIKKTVEYFSLNNSPEINNETFAKDSKHHSEIFNKIREYFHNQVYDRERVLAIGRMEMETNMLNRYWKNAREYVMAENQRMKEISKMTSEELINLNPSEFHNTNFNSADVIRFRVLNKKYFNDPLVNSYVERIEEIVSETEQLRMQIEYKWKEEQNRRGLHSGLDSQIFGISGFSDQINSNYTITGRNQGKIKDFER